jgi:hypothetical protein
VYPHPTATPTQRPLPVTLPSPATDLSPGQCQRLALDALAGTQAIARLAGEHAVSRQFVYRQAGKAQRALDNAFAPDPGDGPTVLFTLPVTKPLLRQIVLGLPLICHSSFRGAAEFLKDVFDFPLSLGSVANIVRSAVGPARAHNAGQDLSSVRVGAHDEIYQTRRPVLVGLCADSTYCYLLSQEQHRDADTWGIRLLELAERGFAPEATIADGGTGLRKGQGLAAPALPCRGDVFHALHEVGRLVRYLEGRAYRAIATRTELERQQATPGKRRDRQRLSLAQRLRHARPAEARAIALADDVALLRNWLRQDILSLAGPDQPTRRALFDFVIAELRARASECPERIKAVCQSLENQRQALLAFAAPLDDALAAVAAQWAVPVATARELLVVRALPLHNPRRWPQEAALRRQLGRRYHGLSVAGAGVARRVVRASSVAENLNSRLRGYFFLRRELGAGYLSLLQFFLNHRRFQRSEHAERVGKSPAELLTGQSHPHWLELLGYQRFQCN